MKLSSKSALILDQIHSSTKLGDLRKMAKDIKKDHELALELWSTKGFMSRQLAILIMDPKRLSQDLVNGLVKDMEGHPYDERIQLMDWLMANQLSKDKRTVALMESWENSSLPLQRRIFWYYQARLRWMGQSPPPNTAELLSTLENRIAHEEPEVQWAMNFLAGWIGVFDLSLRERCIVVGINTGLFKDEMVSKGCTPNYLPSFIAIESKKRNL